VRDNPEPGGYEMSALQIFFLGMMVAWTPSLVILAWCLNSDDIF
jgi:hypothetical protein